jgi:hypothetical protein
MLHGVIDSSSLQVRSLVQVTPQTASISNAEVIHRADSEKKLTRRGIEHAEKKAAQNQYYFASPGLCVKE